MTNTDQTPDGNNPGTEPTESTGLTEPIDQLIDDDTLASAAGGQTLNSTELIYASTFIPFDSSF